MRIDAIAVLPAVWVVAWDFVAADADWVFDAERVDARVLEILDLCADDVVVVSACAARTGAATRETRIRQASDTVFQ